MASHGQALQDEREAFEYAQVLYGDELYETAAEEFRRFILNYPTSERLAQARLRLADAYYRAGSLTESVEAYQIFVDRNPNNIEVAAALRNRAGALERLSDYGRAAAAFTELYDRFRTGEYAVQDLLSAGTNSRKASDFATAERVLRMIITDHPSTPLLREAAYNLGLVLIDQDRESEALKQLETVVESEREPDALLEIGRIALGQDDLTRTERTFADLRKRFSRTRSAHESYLVLGDWYETRGEWAKATEIYEIARSSRLSTEHQQKAILGLARVYRESGKDALQLYTQFLKVYPASPYLPDARLGLGRSYVDKRQYGQAIDAFNRLQETFPRHPYSVAAHRDIGDVYAALGSPRQALAAYKRHLTLSADSTESAITRLKIAVVYRGQLGWTDLALDVLSDLSLVDDRRTAASAQFQLGQTHEDAGNTNLAIREYRNYLERFAGEPDARLAENRIRYLSTYAPTKRVDRDLIDLLGLISATPQTRLQLGRLLFRQRHYDQAIPHLEAASSDTSGSPEGAYLLAEALLAIDRRQDILTGSGERYQDRALAILRELSATGQNSEFADDAAFRVIEIQHGSGDTASVRTRIEAYDQFVKSYPTSDRLSEGILKQANAHLTLARFDTKHVDLARAKYGKIGNADDKLGEQASYGIARCLAIKQDYVAAENALRDFLFTYPNSDLGEEARFQLGLILLERGYLQSASTEFAELLTAPTSVDLEKSSRALLAECYFRLEDFEAAIRIDETLLARGAEPAVLRRLGESYTRTDQNEKALSVLGTYVREFSDAAGADTLAFRRAELLAQLDRISQAIEAFRNLSEMYQESGLTSDALGSVARLQFQQGNYKAALAAVTTKAAAGDQMIGELRIVTLLRLDRAKQARKEIKTFKNTFPGATEALARFEVEGARVQLRYGNPKGARKALEGVIKKYAATPSAADAEYYLVEALKQIGKPEEHFGALISFVKSHKENVNWARANLELAEIHEDEDDYVSASRAYLNALTGALGDDERPKVLERLYESHRNLRLYDSAISYARDLVRQYPHHPLAQSARIRIGEIYSEKGDFRQAIHKLRPLLAKLKDDPWSSAQLVIAKSHQSLGEYESALREFLKMIYNPQGSVNWLANAFYGRGQCFRSMGRTQEAITEFSKISARFPGTPFAQQADQIVNELRSQL